MKRNSVEASAKFVLQNVINANVAHLLVSPTFGIHVPLSIYLHTEVYRKGSLLSEFSDFGSSMGLLSFVSQCLFAIGEVGPELGSCARLRGWDNFCVKCKQSKIDRLGPVTSTGKATSGLGRVNRFVFQSGFYQVRCIQIVHCRIARCEALCHAHNQIPNSTQTVTSFSAGMTLNAPP